MHHREAQTTVLLVEDDPDITSAVQALLEEEGYAVTSVGDAHDALACLERRRPEVVLLDCVLPGGGMHEVLAKADQIGAAVVLASGDPEILAPLAAFGYPCLHKPFSLRVLLTTLGKTLQTPIVDRRPSAGSAPLPVLDAAG